MEENTAQEIESQQDAHLPKKNSKFGLVVLILTIVLMLVAVVYVADVGGNQKTIDKAVKYDFYKNIIDDYEAKAKTCASPIMMFCA